jgi:aspartyl-tRNA(Asn)/glutamyl-tRNA(Gln) amidotransferase subunit C
MTQLTNEDIKKIAKLACIEIDDATSEILTAQVGSTIEWVSQLKEANTDGVEPLTNVHQNNLRLTPDIIADGNITDDILHNATNPKYNYFSVPKVIE